MFGGGLVMARPPTASSELRTLRDNQKKLITALQMVFDLLEDYAPRWYTRKYRDLLSRTLAHVEARAPHTLAKFDKSFSNKRKRYTHSANHG